MRHPVSRRPIVAWRARGAASTALGSVLLGACLPGSARYRGPGRTPVEGGGSDVAAPGPTSRCEAAVAATLDTFHLAPSVAAGVRQGLAAYHGLLLRWPLDRRPVIRVWVQPSGARFQNAPALRERPRLDGAPDEQSSVDPTWSVVRGAQTWDGVVHGLRVIPARDSATAAVHVLWERPGHPPDHPARGLHGHTAVVADRGGAITTAEVTLGRGEPGRAPPSPADLRAVAAHEFGHVLGLADRTAPHGERWSVMAPDVRADGASATDRAVLRAWYALAADRACAWTEPPPAPPAAGDHVASFVAMRPAPRTATGTTTRPDAP